MKSFVSVVSFLGMLFGSMLVAVAICLFVLSGGRVEDFAPTLAQRAITLVAMIAFIPAGIYFWVLGMKRISTDEEIELFANRFLKVWGMNDLICSFLTKKRDWKTPTLKMLGSFLSVAAVLWLVLLVPSTAAGPSQMAGTWRGHSSGKQELAFGISRTESDDQITISPDLRKVMWLPIGAASEIGGKMQKSPVHAVATALTTEARLDHGDLVATRVVRYSTGENRETWTFHLQSPSTLRVRFASSYIDSAGGQLSWRKTEGTLQRQ